MNSKVHQSANFPCPGRDCGRSFISAGALTLHFESGKCPSGMTRDQLNRLVVRADTNHYITNPSRLLTGPQGWSEPPAPASMWATERSWNGSAYECFLCNSTYTSLVHLNQHLKSPRHQDKIYRCPKSDCKVEFATLSGLCQHVEGGSCGVRRFRQVRDTMDSLTRGFNMLTV
jgi:Zinc-finger of C2H2 type/Zinc finger, C2H2 type